MTRATSKPLSGEIIGDAIPCSVFTGFMFALLEMPGLMLDPKHADITPDLWLKATIGCWIVGFVFSALVFVFMYFVARSVEWWYGY